MIGDVLYGPAFGWYHEMNSLAVSPSFSVISPKARFASREKACRGENVRFMVSIDMTCDHVMEKMFV